MQDPFERADITSNTYWDWIMNHVPQMYQGMERCSKFAATFKEFPPRSSRRASTRRRSWRRRSARSRRPGRWRRSCSQRTARSPERESRAQAFAYRGMLLPLDDYRKRAPFFVPEGELFTGSLPSLNWKGKVYAWPNLAANYSIYYNKTLFERARVPLPTERWTWSDMARLAQQLTPASAGAQPETWGFPEWQDPSWPPGWYPLLRSFGGEHFDKDQTRCLLGEAGGQACLQFMADLWCRQRATPEPEALVKTMGGTNGVFESGAGAMRLGGANYYRTLETKAKGLFEWGIAHMPLGPSGRFMRVGGSQWSIPVTAKHCDVSWEWLRHQVSDVSIVREIAEEQGATVAHIPTYEKYLAPTGEAAARAGETWRKVFVEDLAKHGVTPNYSRVGDQYAPLLGEEVGALARCGKSSKEAAEAVALRANKFLADTK